MDCFLTLNTQLYGGGTIQSQFQNVSEQIFLDIKHILKTKIMITLSRRRWMRGIAAKGQLPVEEHAHHDVPRVHRGYGPPHVQCWQVSLVSCYHQPQATCSETKLVGKAQLTSPIFQAIINHHSPVVIISCIISDYYRKPSLTIITHEKLVGGFSQSGKTSSM